VKTLLLILSFYPLFSQASQPVLGEPAVVKQAWYFGHIKMPDAWSLKDRTPNVKIAVIDMDFNLKHPDLEGVFLASSKDFSGFNFEEKTGDAASIEHGTMVSSLIGANGLNNRGSSGISRKASLIAINIAPIGPLKLDIVEVFRYAMQSGAKVINCSFGYTASAPMPEFQEVLKLAKKYDVVIVASAGNYGQNNDDKFNYPPNLSLESDNVIAVGASNRFDQAWRWSSYGKASVDIFAPGEDIIVPFTAGSYGLSMGTSEAAPIVSGVVALMRELNPKLTAAQIKTILRSSSDKLDAFKDISVSGGRLNAFNALKMAAAQK
jgi:subtilisin family serine protease